MMTKEKIKKLLFPFHIICGAILLLNLLSGHFLQFTLYFELSQLIKYCFLISGIVLFFVVKDFKGYFSIYAISPVVVLASIFFGIAGIVIAFLMLSFIWPKSTIANTDNYLLYAKACGPLKARDEFELTERTCFIFERRLAEFKDDVNNGDLENSKIAIVNDSAQIKFTKEDWNKETDTWVKKDTLIKIQIP
ncbi:hypothetical protein NAT51_19105 [Flavobacterium amniphilum]|uniref:hypothetical protein n=1 Tax=Flavobacterium amniphilum TaxID=1834035 RepID=UPI00202A9749|nr:hypothetical protein [Flavobacterium amniphilum]MCL9807639.1 hypothetical protein [Flavobacterium amniphilum]